MSDLVEQLKKYHREVVASDEGETDGMALVREAYTEIERLQKANALRNWAQECRDHVLYPLAQQDTKLGRVADGLGQALIGIAASIEPDPRDAEIEALKLRLVDVACDAARWRGRCHRQRKALRQLNKAHAIIWQVVRIKYEKEAKE